MNDTFDFDAAMAEIEPLIEQQQQFDREEMARSFADLKIDTSKTRQ